MDDNNLDFGFIFNTCKKLTEVTTVSDRRYL